MTSVKLEFTAACFDCYCEYTDEEACCKFDQAKRANAGLAEMLAKAPVVYGGCVRSPGGENWYWYNKKPRVMPGTHTARLIEIEKVPDGP